MDEIILTQRYVPFHFVLQAVEQYPEQRAVSLENVCICAFHPKGDLNTALITALKICCLVLAV